MLTQSRLGVYDTVDGQKSTVMVCRCRTSPSKSLTEQRLGDDVEQQSWCEKRNDGQVCLVSGCERVST